MAAIDSTERFSDRVDDYVKYRPGYPQDVLRWLRQRGVGENTVVADVGSGTGILTGMLVGAGLRVFAVEPNAAMRASAERLLGDSDLFASVAGTAEATTLAPNSVELITSGQAFHWFDAAQARREFRRILVPGGQVALIWNDRDADGSALMADYERLLEERGTDYHETTYRQRPLENIVNAFFDGALETVTFPNSQILNEEGLVGRFFSSSYTPAKGDPRYPAAERAARELFSRHDVGGTVELGYITRIHIGRLD